jgi:DNA-binding transcriptional LysR family regulator
MGLSLEAIEIVDAIVRRGSFAGAAAELGKVPSALSYTVRRLEEELDVLLFDRRGNRAQLTDAGRELVEQGRVLLRAADDLASRVREVASGWEVELRIAIDAVIASERVLTMVADFQRSGAPTRIRLAHEVLEGSWDALLDARADLVIGAAHDAPSDIAIATGFSHRLLGEQDFVFCVAPHHPLASQAQPLTRAIRRAHRAVVLADTARRRPGRTLGLLHGQELLTVATMEQKVAAQRAGLGCGFLPEPFARPWLANGQLVELQVEDARAAVPLRYAWRSNSAGKALKWWLSRLDVARVRKALLSGPSPTYRAGRENAS